jgi:2-dehydro-3-deoxyphosphogluconate aldolase/(4S)-4-hydroxy-2-oxoglutarate aldolase
MSEASTIEQSLAQAPVVPVLTLDDITSVAPLGASLARGGLRVVEVTLRTQSALACLQALSEAAPELIVGAGTVLSQADVTAALEHGARFLVTPGTTPALEAALAESGALAIPGVATASEALARLERGFRLQKLFPAEAVGGVRLLRSLAGPLPSLRFMPTGGIGPSNAPDYLALPNVAAIGGSWIAEPRAIAAGDWSGIESRAREAVALRTAGTP